MSTILYYSNYCPNCKDILQNISRSQVKNDIHFVCVDSRVTKPNGATYIILANGQEILLPPTIVKVPALLLLDKGHQVLFGSDINNYIEPKQEAIQNASVMNNGEPLAFSLSAYLASRSCVYMHVSICQNGVSKYNVSLHFRSKELSFPQFYLTTIKQYNINLNYL